MTHDEKNQRIRELLADNAVLKAENEKLWDVMCLNCKANHDPERFLGKQALVDPADERAEGE